MAGDNGKIEKDANRRLAKSRDLKAQWEPDFREGMFFACPTRHRFTNSTTAVTTRPRDAGEANTSFAIEMATDFATVLINTYLPEAEPWCKREPGKDIDPASADLVKSQCEKQDGIIFDAIAASNFYPEMPKACIPDAALGTIALWIEMGKPWEAVKVFAVPTHELEILIGPDGNIDFRARVQHVEYGDLASLLPGVKFDDVKHKAIKNAIDKKPESMCELRRIFWREWDDETDLCWRYVLMIDKTLIKSETMKGWGSCPLIVARFNPLAEWPWGQGPLINALPDLRVLDELTLKKVEALDFSLRPPMGVPDSSIVNFENGVEAGYLYPIRPGDEVAVKAIYEPNPPQAAIYEKQDLETRIKRLFYLDFPEQRGDTPPTATQWFDERQKAQQRIGTPGMPFWKECAAEVFMRFKFLLEKKGTIKPVVVNGRPVPLMPYNPAQRAAEQMDVAAAAKFGEIGGQMFPEEFKMMVDGGKSLANLRKKLGADKIIVMRDPEDIKNAVQQISQLAGGATPGAPAQTGAPPMVNPAEAPAPAPVQNMIRASR